MARPDPAGCQCVANIAGADYSELHRDAPSLTSRGVSRRACKLAPAIWPGKRTGILSMTELSRLVDKPGGHTLVYADPVFPDRPLLLHSARPRRFDGDTPVLIVHHGVGRNGRDYRDYWLRLVDDAGILAIAVEFTEEAFPDYLWYHFDDLLFAALRDQRLTRRQRYGLFGHSAGGQFVHRMLSFGFRDRVACGARI